MENNYIRVPLLIDKGNGRRETVIAEPTDEDDIVIVRSIPAFTYGLGLNDKIRLLDRESGRYDVIQRGRFVVVRLYVDGSLDQDPVKNLIDRVVNLGGQFEVGRNATEAGKKSLLLIALKLDTGFDEIEALFKPFEVGGCQWEYGNVYDANGEPLGWW